MTDSRSTPALLDLIGSRTAAILSWIDAGHEPAGRLASTRAVIEVQEAAAELRRRARL